jgi:hypothetical protein
MYMYKFIYICYIHTCKHIGEQGVKYTDLVVWSSDFHISPIADIKNIVGKYIIFFIFCPFTHAYLRLDLYIIRICI